MAFGLAEAANLAVNLSLKGNFVSQIGASQKALTGLNKEVSNTGSRAYKAGTQIGTGIKSGAIIAASAIGFLGSQVIFGLHQLSELEKITAQTNAVLKSTKGAAGESSQAIRDLAQKYEDLNAIIDDKVIQSGENVLLTFTAIRKDAFEPALKAALDLATAMGEDLHTAALQVGKALQDPTKGITALRRAGVAFSADQITLIKHLQKTGDLLGAQKIILGELGKEFGGSFAAQGKTAEGAIAGIGDAVEDLQKALATALFPTIQKVLPKLRAALSDPAVIAQVTKLGDAIAGLFSDENIAQGGKILSSVFETAKAAGPILVSTAQATLGIVKAAVGLFQSLPAPLQQLAVGAFAVNKLTGGLVTNIAGGFASLLSNIIKSKVVNVAGAVVNVSGGIPGVPGAGVPGEGGLLAGALKLLPATLFAGAIVAAAVPIGKAFADALPPFLKGPDGSGKTQSQIAREAADAAIAAARGGGLPNPILDRGGRESGVAGSLQGKILDDKLAGSLKQLGAAITATFRSALDTLKHSTDPARLLNAVKTLREVMVANGHGSVEQTKATIAALTRQLQKTHDPTLQSALRGAITDLKAKIPGREYAVRELAKADKIIHGTGTVSDKIKGLQAIENDLKNHKLPGQTKALQAKIDALQRKLAITTAQTTQAVKDKDLSVRLTVPISNKVIVNSRTIANSIASYHNYYSVNRSNPGGATIR